MRLVHFIHQGRAVGGLEQLLADVLAVDTAGLEHAVVMHWGEQCDFAGKWPVRTAPWCAEAKADPDAVRDTLRALDGLPVFHAPPDESLTLALHAAGTRFAVFCHGHEWWCASGSRYYAHTRGRCAIHASTARCAIRYHALGCGSLRLGNMVKGLTRAGAGRAALAAATDTLVLSAFMGNEAQRHGAGRVHKVPAPTSLAGAGPAPEARGATRVLFASRLTKEKGIDTLLDAFEHVQPGIALDIAGTGIAAAATARRLERHPARDRIRLLGHVDRPALREALARASLAVVPSSWPEPFGIIGIEALAFGRPVVATDVGGMGEWARADLGVLTVPADDPLALAQAIERVAAEPEWSRRAREAGAAWVASHHAPSATAAAFATALT